MDGLSESLSTSTWTWNLPVSSDTGVEETGLQSRFVRLCFRTMCVCFLMQVSVALSYLCLCFKWVCFWRQVHVCFSHQASSDLDLYVSRRPLKAGPPVQ